MRHAKKLNFPKLDAVQNAFLSNQLELVKARTYDRKYRNLKAKQFIPLDGEIDEATETMRIASYSQVGVAHLLQAYSDNLPRADVSVEETTVSFRGMADSYGYSVQEVRAASKSKVNLSDKKAAAARRAMEVLTDRILAVGDTATGLLGLLNQTNALTYTVPNGAGGSALWSQKTAQEKLADMIGICEYITTTTNEVESPNMLLLPRAQYVDISTTRFSTGDQASNMTILKWFKEVYPNVAVDQWYRCQGAGSGGADRMVAYSMDPEHIQGAVPMEFMQHPPEARNLEFIVACEGRIGGVFAYYPLSIAYGDGI